MNTLRAKDRTLFSSTEHLYPVVLCGGAGKRLWPLSRRAYPKQLLPMLTERTLLQETAIRATDDLGLGSPLVLCNEIHKFLVADQLAEAGIDSMAILCEPAIRNTGPALAAAANYLREQDPEATMLVMPADHRIKNPGALAAALRSAIAAAGRGRLVTFGIQPTRADTGYGYIERGDPLEDVPGAYTVERFIEKPKADVAEQFVAGGSYFWNSGMFLLPVAAFLEELARHDPASAEAGEESVRRATSKEKFVTLDSNAFECAPNISIDYAVMEHTDRAAVVPGNFAWSDIGCWSALRDADEADPEGNVLRGDVVAEDTTNSYIRADGRRLVAAVGVDDLVVIDTDDAVLISTAARSADVGRIVNRIDARPESTHHSRVYRPWGYFQVVDIGSRFQVKHIMVKPGQRLSVQMHHHRAEHWVVVSGTAHVARDEESQLLSENESVFIPLGALHRLENPGNIPLHLIEVQVGSYLGEDDIVRFEDAYGRV